MSAPSGGGSDTTIRVVPRRFLQSAAKKAAGFLHQMPETGRFLVAWRHAAAVLDVQLPLLSRPRDPEHGRQQPGQVAAWQRHRTQAARDRWGRWLKGVVLYGANASGKSTVVQALGALSELVRTSAKITDRKEPIEQIEPFALCPGQEQVPTAFSIAFVAGDVRYEYRVAATRDRIWHESLRAAPKAKEQLWFSRDYDPQADRYHFSPERPTGFRRDPQLEGYTLPNVLFLSKAIANNRTDLEPVFNWLTQKLIVFDMSTANPVGMLFSGTLESLQDASLGCRSESSSAMRTWASPMPRLWNGRLPGRRVWRINMTRDFSKGMGKTLSSSNWVRRFQS